METLYGEPERAVPGLILITTLALSLLTRSPSLGLAFGLLASLTWRYWSARLVINDIRLGEITLHCPGTKGKEVWLTFDDGPGPHTLPIVEELNRRGLPATFFFVGEQIERYGDLCALKCALTEGGHSVANHTYSHPNLLRLKASQQEWELRRTEELLDQHFAPLKSLL